MSPIYSYQCRNCQFEIIDKLMFTDPKEIDCPNCGSKAVKIPTFANFVIHGFNNSNDYMGEKHEKNKK